MTDTSAPSSAVERAPFGDDIEPAVRRQMAAQWREAQRLAMTSVIPKSITHHREKVGSNWQDVPNPPAQIASTVFAVVRFGSFLGFEPAISLSKIDVIEGRLEARYDALLGLMMAAGHQVRIREATEERAVLRVRRYEDRDDPDGWQEVSFTVDEARAAGYVKDSPDERERKSAWHVRKADMLLSKAAKRAFRWVTPDALVERSAPAYALEGAVVADLAAPPAAAPHDQDDEIVDAELVDDRTSERGSDGEAREGAPASTDAPLSDADGPAGDATGPVPAGPSAPVAPEPLHPFAAMSQATMRRLHALLHEHGIADADRHAWASRLLGREVVSMSEVDAREGGWLIGQLEPADDEGARGGADS